MPAPKRDRRWTPRVAGPEMIILPVVLTTPVLVLLLRVIPTSVPPWLIVGGVFIFPLAAVAWMLRSILRCRSLLRRHGRCLCLNCLYPLEGLAYSGVCPECREPYERAELARLWLSWELAINKDKTIAREPPPTAEVRTASGSPPAPAARQ